MFTANLPRLAYRDLIVQFNFFGTADAMSGSLLSVYYEMTTHARQNKSAGCRRCAFLLSPLPHRQVACEYCMGDSTTAWEERSGFRMTGLELLSVLFFA